MLSCGVLWSKESAATNALEMNQKMAVLLFPVVFCLWQWQCGVSVCLLQAGREEEV